LNFAFVNVAPMVVVPPGVAAGVHLSILTVPPAVPSSTWTCVGVMLTVPLALWVTPCTPSDPIPLLNALPKLSP